MAPRSTRKRDIAEVEEADTSTSSNIDPMLSKIRNFWQFASLMQFIQLFGSVLKIDNEIDIDVLEDECLKPGQPRLAEIGLCFLKWISSHRGLTPDLFDEYTRRQYTAKAPLRNPFGEDEEPRKFADFDVFLKLKVLQQLSVWTLNNPEKMRERMDEKTIHQTSWRIDVFGWDAKDRTYYVLDDNRLYRRTEPPPLQATPKKSKAKAKAKPKPKKSTPSRSSKRQKLNNGGAQDHEPVEDEEEDSAMHVDSHIDEDDGFGGAKWECIAVDLGEFNAFIDSFRKTKDQNEKNLVKRLQEEVLPDIERAAASKERRALKRQRDLEALQKLATAKRSSRLADKQIKQKEEEEAAEAERKRLALLAEARKEEKKHAKMEQERESRIMTREQRTKDREMKRVLAEERLNQLSSRDDSAELSGERFSERARKAKIEAEEKEMELLTQEIAEDEESWYFDCEVCLKNGENYDDGTHSVMCEQCNVWHHSECHGFTPEQIEKDEFHFICRRCKRPPKKIRLNLNSSSPPGLTNGETQNDPNDHTTSAVPNGSTAQPSVHVDVKTNAPPKKPAPTQGPPKGFFPPPQSSSNYQVRPSSANGSAPSYKSPYQESQIHSQAAYPPPAYYGSNKLNLPTGYHVANSHSSNQSQPQPQVYHQQPLQQQTPNQYNPHTNNFDRQGRPPVYPGSPPRNQTPQQPKTSSPTPSLHATQGATDVRFSPSRPTSSSSQHLAGGMAQNAHNSYSPTSSRPLAGAFSPTKQASSPLQQQPSPQTSSFNTHRQQSPTAAASSSFNTLPPLPSGPPSFTLAPNGAASGISPIKHDIPPSSSSSSSPPTTAPNSSFGFSASQAASAPRETPAKSLQGGSSQTHPHLTPAPTLSPSVNVNGTNPTPPVKKQTPNVSPALAGQRSFSGQLDVSGLPGPEREMELQPGASVNGAAPPS